MRKGRKSLTQHIALLLFAIVTLVACEKDDQQQSRNFYMGFTPFPYESSVDAANFTYARLSEDADIINHHFDNGVPWIEAFSGDDFSESIMGDWNFRKSQTKASHKIYLSVTPINFTRTGLAAYRGEQDNMALPSPWDTYSFNSIEVKTAYLNYCKRIIDFFNPEYFNMAIEANLLYVNNPARWSEYLELHQYIYSALKASYPSLPIFCSVSGAYLLEGFINNNDHVQQRLAVLQLLEYSDLYSLSFYSYLTTYLGNPYPANTFDALFNLSDKPLAIAETGYAAQTFSIDIGSGLIKIESDQEKQEKYIRDLLTACMKRETKFVINFVVRDYDQLWAQIGSPNDIAIAWRDTGLIDENGEPRKAYSTWKEFKARKFVLN
jgi:hypothetical protein